MGVAATSGTGQGYLLGIDAGQTFTKAVLFTLDGTEKAIGSTSIPTLSPHPRWQERDMDTTWERTAAAIRECVVGSGVDPAAILAVGLCGHNDGVYLVDAAGRPVRNAILATDSRAIQYAGNLASGPAGERALAFTGQVPAPYSPSALLSWLRDNEPAALEKARWQLFCKDWLRLQLTGEVATDPTEASASFTDVKTQSWSLQVLDLYGLSGFGRLLPPILPSAAVAGAVTAAASELTGLKPGTPVISGAHDVDGAALGIGAARVGDLSIIMGTFSINQIVSDTPITDPRWQARTFLEKGRYLNMSTSPTSASNFEWAVRTLGRAEKADYAGAVAAARIDRQDSFTDSPLFLPYLYGSPAVAGNPGATLAGLHGSHNLGDIYRAVLEGVVFNHRWHVDALRQRFDITGPARLCGGGAKSPEWSQLMSNALRIPIEITDAEEAGARGAAMLAGIGSGVYNNVEDAVSSAVRIVGAYEPDPEWMDLLNGRYASFLRLMEAAGAAAHVAT